MVPVPEFSTKSSTRICFVDLEGVVRGILYHSDAENEIRPRCIAARMIKSRDPVPMTI